MLIRCASFNVLADEYLWPHPERYPHVAPGLRAPGARIELLVSLIMSLNAHVVCLQEVEIPLRDALVATGMWGTVHWTPKENREPDGCLTLVRHNVRAKYPVHYAYADTSGHVAQAITIGEVAFVNTHLAWAEDDDPDHIGIRQARELREWLGPEQPAVIFTDCNDRPDGPVRRLLAGYGFKNVVGDGPTAFVNGELAAIDIIAARGVDAVGTMRYFDANGIPNSHCPSDHIPVLCTVRAG